MIILLNGPPYCGKDTAGDIIRRLLPNVEHYKLSVVLKRGVKAIMDVPVKSYWWLDANKDLTCGILGGSTYRQAQIELFNHMKKLYGEDILAKIAVKHITNAIGFKHTVITDCGRSIEAKTLVDKFGYGNVAERSDCTFKDDIREYVSIKCKYQQRIKNDHDLDIFESQIKKTLVGWEVIHDR
jgi:hypothetical protein